MMGNKSFVFRFADVEVREREFSLTKAGEVLPVEPKAFRVLLILLRNPQKLITKEELLYAVWGDAAVTENSLTRSIALLRRLLGDEIRNPKFIETVATVGYRFMCKVEVSEDGLGNPAVANTPNAQIGLDSKVRAESGNATVARAWPSLFTNLPSFAGIMVIATIVLAAAAWYLNRPRSTLHVSGSTRITLDGRDKFLAGADGNRLYFTQPSPNLIGEVGVKGGGIGRVLVDLPGTSIWLLDVSPEGSNALIGSGDAGNPINSLWNVRILGGAVKRLGEADNASFSPDSESVIYTTHDGDIYTVRADGTGVQKLATPGPGASHPRQSPDGNVIRFDRVGLLWEMNSDGSNVHPLFQNWKVPGSQCCGHWTPDGNSYFFLIAGSPSAGVQIWAHDERRGLFRWFTTQPVQLTTGPIRWGPIIGKDWRTIFASGRTVHGELSRFDSKTKQLLPFLDGISAEFVSFSNDGKFVAYVSYPDGLLMKANRDGSNPVQLSDAPLYPVNPRWSPDGKEILFAAESSDGRMVMYVVPINGGSPERLLPRDDQNQGDPNWSPDGKKVVFTGGNSRDATKEELRILDRTSMHVDEMPESTGLWSPRWSPDGRYIAALDSVKPDLMMFDLETKRWSTPLQLAGVEFPGFSKDSSFIYFLRTGPEQGVFRVRVTGGKVERVVDMRDLHLTGLYNFSMSLDPTDAPLVLRDGGGSDIYVLTLER